jgi:dihydroflavonol-4-reductase
MINAAEGCEYIVHVVSPYNCDPYKTEAQLVLPAVEKVLIVLKAAEWNKVKRVVMTSSA